jgi:hypothetical protein
MTGSDARRLAMRLATAVPFAWIAWCLISVLLDPGSDASRPWLENSNTLLGLEIVLLLATPVTVFASQIVAFDRSVEGQVVMAGLVGLVILWMWKTFGGSPVFWGAASLLAGRYVTGLLGTDEVRFDLYERAMVGAAVFVSALAIGFVVFMPKSPPGREEVGLSLQIQSIGTLAIHYCALAILELPGLYRRWLEPVMHRPSLLIEKPWPTGGGGTRLVFSRDTLEVVADWRSRPSFLAVLAGAYLFFLLIPVSYVLEGIQDGEISNPAPWYGVFLLAAVGGVAWILLRDYIDAVIHQIRHHEIAIFKTRKNDAGDPRILTEREVERIEIVPESKFGPYVAVRLRDGEMVSQDWTRMSLIVPLEPLRRLFDLYFRAEVTPQMLRLELARDPELAAMLGPELSARLAAPPADIGHIQIACPKCRETVWSDARRCRFCALPYPGMGER